MIVNVLLHSSSRKETSKKFNYVKQKKYTSMVATNSLNGLEWSGKEVEPFLEPNFKALRC